MNVAEKTFLDLLEDNTNQDYNLTVLEMANLYVNSALTVSIMEFLKEQLWLKNKSDKKAGKNTSYENFITPYFYRDLAAISFLKDFLVKSGSEKINKIKSDAKLIEEHVISEISERSGKDQKVFLVQSLNEMQKHFIQEENQQGPRLYRSFDNIDNIFGLNYELDLFMNVDKNAKERLYQRSGIGVQSGYSSILLSLHNVDLNPGDIVVDLGSGYGRVGLVCSLLNPDISFIGYEYVAHRVEVSNSACAILNLQESLDFKTQDLSQKSFKIPVADIYYLYDPFTKETYDHVLKQLVEVSKKKEITVITKGNARTWLVDMAQENSWPKPIFIDDGNLCIFKSQ